MNNDSFWERFARRRIPRRRALSGAGTLLIAGGAIAIAGCSDTDTTVTPTEPPTASRPDEPDRLNVLEPAVPGGTYVTANSAAFGTWDPHVGIAVASAYFPRIYNLLLSQSPTKPEYRYMDLAESYETPDDTTHIFKIRPGVKIAQNTVGIAERDIDTQDVKATFDRLRSDKTANAYSFASKYIDNVEVTGDTVTIKTTEPYAWFVQRISNYNVTIPPREITTDPAKYANQGVGGGPYTLISVAENEAARLTRNNNFYRRDTAANAQLPYIDNLEVRAIFDRGTQRAAFIDGQTHQYWAQSSAEARDLGDHPVVREPVFAYVSVTLNPKKGPFTDPRVRRAVSRAINRQQIVDVVYSGDAQANGLVHWPLGAFALPDDELATQYQPHDPADARALVEAAGGVTLRLTYPANTTIQEHGEHLPLIIEQLRDAGIEVEQIPLEFTNWITSYQTLDYDSSLGLNQIYESPELPLLFHASGGPFGDNTYIQGLEDAEVDAAVRKANTTLDVQEQIANVHDAQKLIYSKDPGFLPLVGPFQHFVYSNKLHNIPAGVGTTAYSLADYWIES